jgi:hypothetical protein
MLQITTTVSGVNELETVSEHGLALQKEWNSKQSASLVLQYQ